MRTLLPALAALALLGCPNDKKTDATPETKGQESSTKEATKTPPKEVPKRTKAKKAFEGPNFTTIQPEGFAPRQIPGTPKGALAIYRTRRQPKPESFLTSIVFVPIAYPDPAARVLIEDPKLCQSTGEQMVALVQQSQKDKLTLVKTQVAALPTGKACQTEITAPEHENPHNVINTVMQSDVGDLSVTCNIARGDAAGRGACMEVLNEWKWKKP